METKKVQRVNETKSCLIEKIDKIHEALVKLIKQKR
jgi:hypothetical protein